MSRIVKQQTEFELKTTVPWFLLQEYDTPIIDVQFLTAVCPLAILLSQFNEAGVPTSDAAIGGPSGRSYVCYN